MDQPKPLSREEAETAVLDFESRVKAQVRGFSPESFAVAVARRFRLGQADVDAFRQHPPHFLIHALEANCAYYEQWRCHPLTDKEFATTINLWHGFSDPVLTNTLHDSAHMFGFVQYIYRTQIELQGEGSHIRFGRGLRMFGDATRIPRAAAAFTARYGLSPRDWIKLVLILHLRTGEAPGKRLPPPEIRRKDLELLPSLGVAIQSLDRFLAEAALPWEEVGAAYLRSREPGTKDRQSGPLTWSQRRPTLAKHPIMRMSMGYLVPAPPLLLRQVADGLFERFDAMESAEVRADIGEQFERYIGDMIRSHLPDRTLVEATTLKVAGEKSCDFVLDLQDAVLLIECKAVTLERELVTEKAVMNSGAIQRLLDGYVQIVRTAARIQSGGYPPDLIPREKPVIGLVVTLGNVPGADNAAVLNAMRRRLDKEQVPEQATQCLKHRPQPFDAEAFEYLVLLLRGGQVQATDIFAEKLAANPWDVGDWATFLNRRIQPYKPVDLTFWKRPVAAMVDEIRLRTGPSA